MAGDHSKKADLKLMGEIAARVLELQAPGKALLVAALADGVPASEIATIKQIVERHAALTDKGAAYVDGTLGVEREDPEVLPDGRRRGEVPGVVERS